MLSVAEDADSSLASLGPPLTPQLHKNAHVCFRGSRVWERLLSWPLASSRLNRPFPVSEPRLSMLWLHRHTVRTHLNLGGGCNSVTESS